MSIGLGIAISPSFEGSHIPGVSALFSYAKSSFNQGEADPTPTITGNTGGTFTGTSGIVFVDSGSSADSSTGQIDLSASSIATHTITYTVSGVSSNFELGIIASAAFSYSASTFTQADSNPTPTITGTTGGTFSGTSGLVFVSTSTGEINLSASSIAAHVVFYIVDGVQASQTIDIQSAPYSSTMSFSFDGVNDYFDIGQIDVTGTISVSLWIYPTATGDNGGIFTMVDSTDPNPNCISLALWQSNIQVYAGSGITRKRSTDTIAINNWYHIVIVKSATAINNIYINGVNKTLNSTGAWNAPVGHIDTPQNKIGEGSFNGSNFNFTGNIDELSLWNTGLSSDAITEIYNSGAPNDLTSLTNASSSNLVAWYKMGE